MDLSLSTLAFAVFILAQVVAVVAIHAERYGQRGQTVMACAQKTPASSQGLYLSSSRSRHQARPRLIR
jgi:hypothetical protein